MKSKSFTVRDAEPSEHEAVGQLMVDVYSNLKGFFSPEDQTDYYELLANIGIKTADPHTRILVANDEDEKLVGAVVYFSDMASYSSGGTATSEKDSAGFRLLAVDSKQRGRGLGKVLSQACIDEAIKDGLGQVIIHTTDAMKLAWGMYERMGFRRSEDLDFLQEGFPVYGFRLDLKE